MAASVVQPTHVVPLRLRKLWCEALKSCPPAWPWCYHRWHAGAHVATKHALLQGNADTEQILAAGAGPGTASLSLELIQ